MSKIQLHAYILIVFLGLSIAVSRHTKPLSLEGRPNTAFEMIPMDLEDWCGNELKFDKRTYELLPTCSLLLREYEHDDYYAPMELAVVYGTDLGDFHQPEFCLESQGLRTIEKKRVRVQCSDEISFDAVALIMESDYQRKAFVFWFASEGTTSTFLGDFKLRLFVNRLTARKIEPSALVRLSTQVIDSDEEALDQIVGFAEKLVPFLTEQFTAGGP